MATFNEGILSVSKPEKCGCQELLNKITLIQYGWLRRKCLRNALQIKYIKWPQQYVIIGNKCLYYFNSETSKHPEGAVSLYGFNRVIRASDVKTAEALWAFKLEHIHEHIGSIYFAASSELEMVKWMKSLKSEMLTANNMESNFQIRSPKHETSIETLSTCSWDSGDYRDLEDCIYMEPVESRIPSFIDTKDEVSESENNEDVEHPPLPPRPAFYISSDPQRVSRAKTIPKQQKFEIDRSKSYSSTFQKLVKSLEGEPSSHVDDRLEQASASSNSESGSDSKSYWESVYFHGSKSKASEIIARLAENGVYLIRNGDDNTKVLLFYSHPMLKKFRIMEKEDGHVTIAREGPDFETIEELLYYYYTNDLPNVNMKLVIPYKLHSDYR